MKFDIKAEIINLRESKAPFKSGYSPAFSISNKEQYLTSGRINFDSPNFSLKYNKNKEAYISFITPEIYPHTLWVGKVLKFYEGTKLTGEAKILEIYNKLLETDEGNESIIHYWIIIKRSYTT